MFKEANYYPLHALLAFDHKSKTSTPPKFQRTNETFTRDVSGINTHTWDAARFHIYPQLLILEGLHWLPCF